MDFLFHLGKIKKRTFVKKKMDDDYYPFSKLIKRYCKILLEKLEYYKNFERKISNKIKQFRKGETIRSKKSVRTYFQPTTREERVNSLVVRPCLFNLNNIIPEEDEEEEEEEVVMRSRRSKTFSKGFIDMVTSK